MGCRVPITIQLIAALTGGSNGYRQGLIGTITQFGAGRRSEAAAPARLLRFAGRNPVVGFGEAARTSYRWRSGWPCGSRRAS